MRVPSHFLITALVIVLAPASLSAQTSGQNSSQKPASQQPRAKAPAAPGSTAKPAPSQAPTTQPAPQSQQPAANPDSVPADAPVITLSNVCNSAPQSTTSSASAGCTEKITKADFEKLADAVNAPAQARDRLAQGYVRLLIMSAAAEKQGLDKDPKTQTVMKLAQLQAMAQELNQRLLKQANDVPADQIDKYYQEHTQDFDQVKVRRLLIPKSNAGKQLDETKQKQLADALQKRAAAGEDFDKLQKEAFTSSGVEQNPPPTDLGQRRRGSLAKSQEDVIFALQSGQVSSVIDDPNSFLVFKAESKATMPLDSVRPEIKQRLAQENYAKQLRNIFNGADAKLNAQYFGTDHVDFGLPSEQEPGSRPPRPVRPATPQQ